MPEIMGGKFVVVGGASLLGSHIGDKLLEGGAREIVLFDNLSLGSTSNIDHLLTDSRCRFVRGDMLRINELFDPLNGADGIFCVAGFLGKPMQANPWVGLDVNIRGLQNVLEAARVARTKKVVFSSSIGVYGALGSEPRDEAAPLRWQGMPPALVLYCASKVLGEGVGQFYAQHHNVGFVALRYSCLYGERLHTRALDATRIIEAYQQIRRGQRPVIDGNENQVQDFVYIGDVARANLLAMESTVSGEAFNIASGVDTSIRKVVEHVLEACDSDLETENRTDPSRVNMPVTTRIEFSRQRAKDLLGWEPEVSVEEGIRRVVAWLDASADKPR